MRTLALTATLATALAGTGCIVTNACDTTDLTIDWTFQDVSGTRNRTCAQVGVAYVDVFIDGTRVVNAAPCLDYGVNLFNVASGRRQVVVEGLDASLVIVNRDQLDVNVSGCAANHVVAEPGEGLLSLDYHFTPADSCAGTYMWYSLTDLVAGTVISGVDATSNPTAFTCGPLVQFRVPLGDYRLDWMQAVNFSSGLARYVAVDQICTATPFSVVGGGTTTVPVTLGVATAYCGVGARP